MTQYATTKHAILPVGTIQTAFAPAPDLVCVFMRFFADGKFEIDCEVTTGNMFGAATDDVGFYTINIAAHRRIDKKKKADHSVNITDSQIGRISLNTSTTEPSAYGWVFLQNKEDFISQMKNSLHRHLQEQLAFAQMRLTAFQSAQDHPSERTIEGFLIKSGRYIRPRHD